MKNKNKKLILYFIALLAVAFSIAQFFFPIYSLNTKDYEKIDDKDIVYYQYSIKENYLLFTKYTNVDINNSQIDTYYHYFHLETDYDFNNDIEIGIRESQASNSSFVIAALILLLTTTFLFGLFVFFTIKSIKFCGIKKTNYFLYSSIFLLIMMIGFLAGTLYVLYLYGFYLPLIKFDYGFYYMINAIVLFFTAHIFQSKYIDFEKDKPTVEKVLFEKYKNN